ncbi:MAG: hypothetical protein AB8E15_11185 [Bdellovibrionales bacterium]
MRKASIDIGTNSFLLLIGELDEQAQFRELFDYSKVVKLGKDLYKNDKSTITVEALERAEACFKYFKEKLLEYKVEEAQAVATSAARDASNSNALISLGKKYDIPIAVIDGKREAELSYSGAFKEESSGLSLVVDLGGGSTEFLYRDDSEIYSKSIDIGVVRLTDSFVSEFPTSQRDRDAAKAYVVDSLKELTLSKPFDRIVAVAGTPTCITSVIKGLNEFDKNQIDGFQLTKSDLDKYEIKLSELSLAARSELPGMQTGREDVLAMGCLILSEILNFLGKDSYEVSTRGVRYGLLAELFLKS